MAISQFNTWHLVVKNGNFTLLLTSSSQEWQFHIATDIHWSRMAIAHCYWQLVVKNGNFTLLLTSCGQYWQFHIAAVIYVVKFVRWTFFIWWTPQYQWRDALNTSTKKHTRWTYFGWWTPHMLNGNFTLLLTSSGQEWQFHIATDIHWSGMGISHCYLHLVVRNGNFTLLLTWSGQQWQFYIPTDIQWSRMVISHCY